MSSTRAGNARTPPPSRPKAARFLQNAGRGQRLSLLNGSDRRRLVFALLLSLLIHALLFSLTFGGEGPGLPGFEFPWRDRRIEVPELRVVIVPMPVTASEPAVASIAEPPQQPPIEQAVANEPVLAPPMSVVPPLRRAADAMVPEAGPTAMAISKANAAAGAADAKAPLRDNGPDNAGPAQIAEPAVIAAERSDEPTLVVPPAPPVPTPVIAAAPSASSPEPVLLVPRGAAIKAREQIAPEAREQAVEPAEQDRSEREAQRQVEQLETARVEAARLEAGRQEIARQTAARQEAALREAARQEAARQEAARQEAARVEAARLEAERQELAQQAAARQDAALQETARQEAARVETARLEAERQEVARQAAARQEAKLQEAARQEATRVETARLEAERLELARQAAVRRETAQREAARQEVARAEAARQEAVRVEATRMEAERKEAERQEAARQEAARQTAARQEAARLQASQDDARREAARRAMGRQLDEEAAGREAASTGPRLPGTLPYSWSSARRGRLFGRTDPNAELILYAEAWARKIQLNMTIDMVRQVAQRPHTDPLVTVAIRRDGSVESVTFVVSSGVAEIDEAIRRIVQSQVPYQAFPPGLASEFDVIEIRRTWYFDMAVRLY